MGFGAPVRKIKLSEMISDLPPLELPVVGEDSVMVVRDDTSYQVPLAELFNDATPVVDFVFTQSSASATWTVNHNLGVRPTATILSPGGVEVEATVVHISVNQLQVLFASPQTGSVRCI